VGVNWVVTGGCGFIGVNLIAALLADRRQQLNIVVVDNLSVGTRDDLAAVCDLVEPDPETWRPIDDPAPQRKVQLLVGDILDQELALRATHGADVIVHLAANTGVPASVQDPRKDMENNVVGTFNYLEAARQNGVKRFVFASSGAPAGEVEPPIHEELAPHPVSPYGASKLAGEGYCSAYARTFGVETVCLRFGNVYGPRSGHKSSVVAKFILRAMAGEPLEVYGDGLQTRDFIYVDDLVAAVRLGATAKDIDGETFQIATHSETSIRELLEHLGKAFDAEGIPMPPVVFTEERKGDVRRNYSDTSKAERRLGWKAAVGLPEGLKTTIADLARQAGSRHRP
jgi:UDP-glucose 4-epimerase